MVKKDKIKPVIILSLIITIHVLSRGSSPTRFIQLFLPDGTEIKAELAVTEEERVKGLMFRGEIKTDQGMLFIMEEEALHGFWMKNMKFPLDILWLNKQKRIVHMETRVPPCKKPPCPVYQSEIPAKYVLELKAGSIEEYNLQLFDKIDFILPPEVIK